MSKDDALDAAPEETDASGDAPSADGAAPSGAAPSGGAAAQRLDPSRR